MSNQVFRNISISILGKGSEELAKELGIGPVALADADVAIFIVSAHDGIARADIEQWQHARELYIPSLVAISETDTADLDFDDMSAIASKMLDPLVVQYLILYSEEGRAIGLIDLATLKILDYTSGVAEVRDSDEEHRELVESYREEFLEMTEGMDSSAVAAGLIYPAFPWIRGSALGLDQIKDTLNSIPSLR